MIHIFNLIPKKINLLMRFIFIGGDEGCFTPVLQEFDLTF